MSQGIDFAEIRARLLQQVEQLARELVPDGHRNGGYWIGCNPTRADKHGTSFWIRIREPAIGAFRDEAGVRGVDDGDVVKLVQYCLKHADLKETRRWCLRWLGMADGPVPGLDKAAREKRQRELEEQRRKSEYEEAQRRQKNAKSAFGWWLKATELKPASFVGSVLERYLLSRAIDLAGGMLARQRPLPGALRFFAAHDYFCHDGEILEGLPCMAALMSGPGGEGRAIHRTWLSPDGAGKAALPEPKWNKPRKIWPAGFEGSVIRIAKGAGNHSPEEAERRGLAGPLVITEGVEDALAVALAMPDHRVWAAGTLGNIAHVPVDHACVSQVIVCADNDWGKGQAEEALERAVAALRKSGKRVAVARSPRGKDMNDLLKGERI